MSDEFQQPVPVPALGSAALPRRAFLRHGMLAAGASLAAPVAAEALAGREPWRGQPGDPFSGYGLPAVHERHVVRGIAANPAVPGNGVSWTPLHELEGTITPSGLHFERHHNGIPRIDPARHKLGIFGAVERALEFDLAALLRYPRQTRQCFIECGGNSNALWRKRPLQTAAGFMHGLASCSDWTGVPLRLLLTEAAPTADAAWLIAGGADPFSLTMSVPLTKALDDCLVALFQNGERIRPEQGYPMRLLVPGWEGVLNIKWLTSLELSATPAMARNETSKYTELQPDGRARMFTFTMAPKSLITSPSAQMRLPAIGLYELSGLAWSGHGRIERVDVSTDGGLGWQPARLEPPILPASFTRFRLPWRWHGEPAILQSRALDERGMTQPARAELLAERGRHGYYHYNAIVSWAVAEDGTVSHLYPDASPLEDPLEDLFLDEKWD